MTGRGGAGPVSILQLSLHGHLVGHLAGYRSGRNILLFAPEFAREHHRPTLGLITHPDFPSSRELLSRDWVRHQRLHPLLSNLLPEGSLRMLLAHNLKVHVDHEFTLLTWLGQDLPGALVATTLEPDEVPDQVVRRLEQGSQVELRQAGQQGQPARFSLAGVQMKFSMSEREGRYRLASSDGSAARPELGDWIIKPPSTQHASVPFNEFTGMRLAELAGVVIPEIRLVDMERLDNLPPINLPQEKQAFAIKRFDRHRHHERVERIHMEDFAQVLVQYPHDKYQGGNYAQLARVLYRYSGDGTADVQQLARRLLVNILLANGDAHLKNWSLLYSDQVTPRLSPAYDILTTQVYMDNERTSALNLARQKNWYQTSMETFDSWARQADIPWRLVQSHLEDTMERVRIHWPQALRELPMLEQHKAQLRAHWRQLHADFRIDGRV